MPTKTLFKQVSVIDVDSPHHGKSIDLLQDGLHLRVNPDKIPKGTKIVDEPGLYVSPGWVDIGAGVGEPGHETRETIRSLQDAAAQGGFTHVVALPKTDPAVDDRSGVEAFQKRASNHLVELSLIAALTKGLKGIELAELGDMANAGVKFFSDGLRAIEDPKLLQLALSYAEPLNGTVFSAPGERRLEGQGTINEGKVSTLMGLPGIPALAEEIGLDRDLKLLDYSGGNLHVAAISLASSVKTLKAAKTKFQGLTYGIPVLNLLLTDEAVVGYDVNLKVRPVLRTDRDRKALVKALLDGQADALISNHQPLEIEEKKVEFPYAAFGAATLELSFAIANTAVENTEAVVDYLSRKNRAFAALPPATISDGAICEITLFKPEQTFVVNEKAQKSLAENTPLSGKLLKGVIFGIASKGELLLSTPT